MPCLQGINRFGIDQIGQNIPSLASEELIILLTHLRDMEVILDV